MTEEINSNDGQADVACEVQKLKFSEICKAIMEEAVEFDVPGILLGADGSEVCAQVKVDKEDEFNTTVFRMAASTFCRLVTDAMLVKPAAWGVLGEWHARHIQAQVRRDNIKDFLEKIENA